MGVVGLIWQFAVQPVMNVLSKEYISNKFQNSTSPVESQPAVVYGMDK